jgi:chromosome segregation ATPase
MKSLNKEHMQIQNRCNEIKDRQRAISDNLNNSQQRLKELDWQHQLLERVRRQDSNAYTAYNWIQNNKSKFKDRVYGPVALEINVPNPDHAKYLEMVIPKWLMMVSCKLSSFISKIYFRHLFVKMLKIEKFSFLNSRRSKGC